ncbi:MAG: hypothetical protein KF878_22775 [Planctomycetes bacterium]|nr:hypothetical protein [Planctomycetota bacterium]
MARKKAKRKARASRAARPEPAGASGRRDAPFGPEFFAVVLPRMIAASPCPPEQENACLVHLADGERLDLVEIVAVAERYVVMAVFEGVGEDGVARTQDDIGVEAVPYDLVLRVSVRRTARRARLGFHIQAAELARVAAAADGAAPAEEAPRRRRRGRASGAGTAASDGPAEPVG